MRTIRLFEAAVATLRLEARGRKGRIRDQGLPAYDGVIGGGIMEPVPGPEWAYRWTADGEEHREAIVEKETERIERERFEPPVATRLSDSARELLRQMDRRSR